MFTKFEYDPPGVDDIVLCAGPKERQALTTVLSQKTNIPDIDDFIRELHNKMQEQANDIDRVNEDIGEECLDEEDADVDFNQHLSDMHQDEVDKVRKHFRVLFIDSCDIYTDIVTLDSISNKEREDIFKNIIRPWLEWVRSAGQNKKPHKKSSNTNNTNNTMNNTNTTPTTVNMFGSIASIFSNMLGTLEPDMVRLSFDGNIAIKTAGGYKTYNVTKKKAVNMDSLVMPEMQAFLLLPSTKVKVEDIIMRDGTFYSIISVDDTTGELVGYNYESGKKETLVKETHCFLGNTYFYSKLVSPLLSVFGNKPKSGAKKEEGSADSEESEDIMPMLLPLAMMSQNGDMNSILPLMFMSKMEGKEDSGMMKMLMLSGMMGNNAGMNNMLPLMLLGGNFPAI